VYNTPPPITTQYTSPTNTICNVSGGAATSTITVTVIGGGGGGGLGYGGGLGGVATYTFSGVAIGATISYFVGNGGVGAATPSGSGGYNSYVTIGNIIIYAGGGGGAQGTDAAGGPGIGLGGGAGGGTGGNGTISPSATVGTRFGSYGIGGGGGTSGTSGIVQISMIGAPVLVATIPAGGTSGTFTGVAGTLYNLTLDASIAPNRSIISPSATITPVAPPSITSAVQNGANIVITCVQPTAMCNVLFVNSVAGSYTYPLTSFIGSVSVSATIVGGGGGGGAGGNGLNVDSYKLGGGGGGSGGTNTVVCNAVSSIAYVVGSAGAGGIESTAPTSGANGGTSTITLNGASTATATATGGGGGSATGSAGSGGTPGGYAGGTGTTNAPGNPGAGGGGAGGPQGFANSQGGGGGGGGLGGGAGGGGQTPQSSTGVAGNGGNGSQSGAGGGGGGSLRQSGTGGNGGTGAAGRVVLSLTGQQYATLTIPNPPVGLTLVSSTATTFTYTNYTAGTSYTFSIRATGIGATNTITTGTVTPLYTPGTPTVTATGTTVNINWTYGASPTGITFNVRDANNNWAGTAVTGSLTTSFTGEGGKSYSIFVFATSGGNQSPNSAATSTTIVVLGPVTFTQNYQLTTQTRIIGTAASTGAATYSGTTDSTLALSSATATGQTLTWTGAVGGTKYNGVTIGAAAGAATTSIANQSLYSAFDPKLIPGCVVWMDAADTTTYTTGSAITSWTSKGTVSGTSGSRSSGTFSSTSINSLPAIAVSAGGEMTIGPSIPFQTTSRSIFLVVTLGAAVAGSKIYFTYGTGISPVFASLNGSLELDFFDTGLLVASSPTNFFSKTSVVAVTSGIYVNGASQTLSVNTGNTGFNIGTAMTLRIGLQSSTAGYTLGELMIYDGVLTNIQRQLIERYLAWKWGLQTQLDPGFPLNNFPGTLPLPNTFPGLSLWLDAADTTTITKNGVNLSTIKDKSGTNNSWTAGGSTATTFGTIGGVQCIRFTGYSTSSITGTYTLTQGQNLTMFLAFNSVDSSQVSLFNNGPSIIFNEGGKLQLVNQTNYTLNYESTVNIPVAANKTYVVAITSSVTNSSTASSFAVVNGTIYGMNVGGYSYVASGSSTFTASTFAYNPWSLGELVVYSGVLTNAQIQQVAGYLIYKWKAY